VADRSRVLALALGLALVLPLVPPGPAVARKAKVYKYETREGKVDYGTEVPPGPSSSPRSARPRSRASPRGDAGNARPPVREPARDHVASTLERMLAALADRPIAAAAFAVAVFLLAVLVLRAFRRSSPPSRSISAARPGWSRWSPPGGSSSPCSARASSGCTRRSAGRPAPSSRSTPSPGSRSPSTPWSPWSPSPAARRRRGAGGVARRSVARHRHRIGLGAVDLRRGVKGCGGCGLRNLRGRPGAGVRRHGSPTAAPIRQT